MTNEASASLDQSTLRPVLTGQSEICIWRLPISNKMFCTPYFHNYLEPFEVRDYGKFFKVFNKDF